MKKSAKIIYVVVFLFFISKQVEAQFSDLGNPIIKNFLPVDYTASSQNWAITQDSRGMMYFGNTSNLIEYDGSNWNKLNLPQNTTVRSLDIDKNGTLFIGSIAEFGYLAFNKLGENKYVSLVNLLPENEKVFQNIWKTLCVTSGVYFFSHEKIYYYDYEKITITNIMMEAFFGFKAFDNVFVLKKDSGLYVYSDNELISLPHTQNFTSAFRMYNILEYNDDKLMIASRMNGLFTYDLSLFKENNKFNFKKTNISENVIQKLNSNVTDYLKTNSLYSSAKINENLFAFGTVTGGIVLTNENGDITKIINTNKGLNNNCVYALYTDVFGNLWAGLQQGISRIDLSYPLNYFNETYNNLSGFVISTTVFKDNLYVATMAGLYKLPKYVPLNTDDNLQFSKLNTEIGEFWSIWKEDDIFLTSGGLGLFQLKNDNLILLEKGLINFTYKSTYYEDIFLITVENKLCVYQLDKSNPENLKINKLVEIPEISTVLTDAVEDKKGSFWISTSYDGVFHLTIDDENFEKYRVKNYNTTNGLPVDFNVRATFIDNKILLGTQKGIYKAIASADTFVFEHDNYFGDLFTKDSSNVGQIFKYKTGYLLSCENLRIGLYSKNENDTLVWKNKISKRFPNSYKIDFLNEKELAIYTSEGLYIFDLEKFNEKQNDFNCLIRNVKLKNDSVLFNGSYYDNQINNDSVYNKISKIQPENLIPVLEFKNNSLTFEFSALFYENSDLTKYSYLLEGFDEEWSSLNTENKAVYTNIPEGKYTFKVKATNVYGEESSIAEFKFSITPPWYRTIFAYIIYVLLAGLIIYLIIKIQTHRLKQQNIELERIVKERTAEIQAQKEEIEAQAHELEKLSIVASETDNAVVIADSEGNFEWINDGFTRLYGYNFDEMIQLFGKNLIETSSNSRIKELMAECLINKSTVIYESQTKTKNGIIIWAQTTITPIVDKNGKVTKLIAIDSDISKLKQAEQEILQKNEEIMLQKEMLEQQNEEITSQKDELEIQNTKIAFQNEQIKSSISYAKTIQTAMLPISSNIHKHFDNFILFRPKDIVSGDLYWFSRNIIENKEYFFIAVIDCTGHGVPGAFMSMISNSLVSEVVNEMKTVSPCEILTLLDRNIRKALNQAETFNQDGMDMCLARIEKKSEQIFEIVFSGAKRPLYFCERQKNQIQTLKADRKSIGGTNLRFKTVDFTNQTVILLKDDTIYLSSDGYIDQNDFDRKRIGSTKFIEILKSGMNLPLNEQKENLEIILDNWQKNTEQRDDITVIGLKL